MLGALRCLPSSVLPGDALSSPASRGEDRPLSPLLLSKGDAFWLLGRADGIVTSVTVVPSPGLAGRVCRARAALVLVTLLPECLTCSLCSQDVSGFQKALMMESKLESERNNL